MTEYDYAKVLEGLHDKILNDEEMLKKVDHPELYALGMCTSIFNRQKAEIERLQTNEQIATAVIAESSAEIERLKETIISKNLTPTAYKVMQENDEKYIHIINGLKAENEDLIYKLAGVMHSVDKWLDGDEQKGDEVQRAATMREKTLQITEKQQAEIERLKSDNDILSKNMHNLCKELDDEKLKNF